MGTTSIDGVAFRDEDAPAHRMIAEYCHNVDCESVYNNIFGMLPIRPYSLRRKVARWISNKINPTQPPIGWWQP